MNPEKLKQLFDLVRTEAQKAGRNPDNIEFTCMGTSLASDNLKALEEIRVSRIVARPPSTNPEVITRALEKFQQDVIAQG